MLGKMSLEKGYEEKRGRRGNIKLGYRILLFTYRFLLANRILPTGYDPKDRSHRNNYEDTRGYPASLA